MYVYSAHFIVGEFFFVTFTSKLLVLPGGVEISFHRKSVSFFFFLFLLFFKESGVRLRDPGHGQSFLWSSSSLVVLRKPGEKISQRALNSLRRHRKKERKEGEKERKKEESITRKKGKLYSSQRRKRKKSKKNKKMHR